MATRGLNAPQSTSSWDPNFRPRRWEKKWVDLQGMKMKVFRWVPTERPPQGQAQIVNIPLEREKSDVLSKAPKTRSAAKANEADTDPVLDPMKNDTVLTSKRIVKRRQQESVTDPSQAAPARISEAPADAGTPPAFDADAGQKQRSQAAEDTRESVLADSSQKGANNGGAAPFQEDMNDSAEDSNEGQDRAPANDSDEDSDESSPKRPRTS
mmetsp:Transcript_9239/g.15858  ORF Transcript_9239/g.15858 Transcript_9239/m.15858 type:complete len:211 (-) Transcript_9239:544-1176(-)